MNIQREKLRALGHHRAMFGGDSSSSSSQTTNNTYTDNRQVNTTTNTSTALSNSGNTTNTDNSNRATTTNTSITTGDMGAIKAGAELGGAALNSSATNTALVLALADRMMTAQNKALDNNIGLASELTGSAFKAYSDASSTASGTKNLVMAGIAVVALAAVTMGTK